MKTSLIAGMCALGALAMACAETDAAPRDAQLELLTWWSQDSELAAIHAVIDVHRRHHPGTEVVVLRSQSSDSMTKDVQDRLADGIPPTAFQANLGGNALKWAESAQSLNAHARAWSNAFRESILERVTSDGAIIGVPLALTRQNNAYYNLALLAELGLDIPVGRDGLTAWLEQLSELGYTHPLCIGDKGNWVSAHVLFEDIVPAYVGADYAQQFWSGTLDANDPLFAEALDYAATLNPFYNRDFATVEWDAGLKRVLERAKDPAQQCLMTPMGDWGGAVLSESSELDRDFAQRSWPGAEGLFVLAGDAFITTRGVKNQEAALDFFDTLASEEGQVAFNAKKGSVPARTLSGDPGDAFGPLTLANLADLSSGTALPAYKVLGSSKFPFDELAVLTHDFLLNGDKQPLIDLIARHYEQLAP